mmetsp:Transcript_494/g.1706  ORF Transcript_494/g.1706 Transcript_494/m.1706 type:complete len:206 (+) Transcript_494:284-901(+)
MDGRLRSTACRAAMVVKESSICSMSSNSFVCHSSGESHRTSPVQPALNMRVAVSGRVYTVKPSASILLLRCASEVLLPPHGPPVITTLHTRALELSESSGSSSGESRSMNLSAAKACGTTCTSLEPQLMLWLAHLEAAGLVPNCAPQVQLQTTACLPRPGLRSGDGCKPSLARCRPVEPNALESDPVAHRLRKHAMASSTGGLPT